MRHPPEDVGMNDRGTLDATIGEIPRGLSRLPTNRRPHGNPYTDMDVSPASVMMNV
jgi:hypothetical protein